MLPTEKSTSPGISSRGLTIKARPVNSTWPERVATSLVPSSLTSVLRPWGTAAGRPLRAGISLPCTVFPGTPSVGRMIRQITAPSSTFCTRFREE